MNKNEKTIVREINAALNNAGIIASTHCFTKANGFLIYVRSTTAENVTALCKIASAELKKNKHLVCVRYGKPWFSKNGHYVAEIKGGASKKITL